MEAVPDYSAPEGKMLQSKTMSIMFVDGTEGPLATIINMVSL